MPLRHLPILRDQFRERFYTWPQWRIIYFNVEVPHFQGSLDFVALFKPLKRDQPDAVYAVYVYICIHTIHIYLYGNVD